MTFYSSFCAKSIHSQCAEAAPSYCIFSRRNLKDIHHIKLCQGYVYTCINPAKAAGKPTVHINILTVYTIVDKNLYILQSSIYEYYDPSEKVPFNDCYMAHAMPLARHLPCPK